MFLVAACNPHRTCSPALREEVNHDDWKVGLYYVKELHQTMDFLKWDYGAFTDREEREYISALLHMRMKVAQRKEHERVLSSPRGGKERKFEMYVSGKYLISSFIFLLYLPS